jgi:hypothetical protein
MELAVPKPELPQEPFLLEAKAFDGLDRGFIAGMHLRLNAVELHALEAPVYASVQRFLHVPIALHLRVQFVANGALAPSSIPGKEAASSEQRWLLLQLDCPARTWVWHGAPAGEDLYQLLCASFVRYRVDAKPPHAFRVSMYGKERRYVSAHNLAKQQALRFKGWEAKVGQGEVNVGAARQAASGVNRHSAAASPCRTTGWAATDHSYEPAGNPAPCISSADAFRNSETALPAQSGQRQLGSSNPA